MAAYLDTGRKTLIDAGLVQVQARDKAGRVFPVELSLSIAQSDAGEVLVSYIRDISTRVAIQRDLVAARDRALAGEQAKAELLALMSHEMRTPLNGLIGSLDLLRDSGLSDAQQQLVEGMERSGHVLLEQVNAVLDTAREDAGGSRLTLGRLDLSALMQEVA
ncbi:MAG: hybrid sensor histidine kinase/response regulator, partial [Rhodobacteraceae bacterium CG17_big_fil_post_rev_8_21_14_2_50_65_11]